MDFRLGAFFENFLLKEIKIRELIKVHKTYGGNKMKKMCILLALALFAVGMLSLASCGKDDGRAASGKKVVTGGIN